MAARLVLSSATDTLALDSVEKNGSGVQVQPSVMGLGLPPKQIQWLEGAGDGAKARGRRTLSRTIDMRVYILGTSHADLVSWCARLARMLAGPAVLTFYDNDNVAWQLNVEHVGGGDWTYGVDTNGGKDLDTVITLKAGDPFWTRSTSEGQGLGNGGAITLNNSGDAKAYPIWTATNASRVFARLGGDQFDWQGPRLGTVVIDSRNGTVRGDGANRYDGLAAGPRFFTLPPGQSTVTVVCDGLLSVTWYPRKWMVI